MCFDVLLKIIESKKEHGEKSARIGLKAPIEKEMLNTLLTKGYSVDYWDELDNTDIPAEEIDLYLNGTPNRYQLLVRWQ